MFLCKERFVVSTDFCFCVLDMSWNELLLILVYRVCVWLSQVQIQCGIQVNKALWVLSTDTQVIKIFWSLSFICNGYRNIFERTCLLWYLHSFWLVAWDLLNFYSANVGFMYTKCNISKWTQFSSNMPKLKNLLHSFQNYLFCFGSFSNINWKKVKVLKNLQVEGKKIYFLFSI